MKAPEPFASITIDPTGYQAILEAVTAHDGINPACRLVPYWRDRMSPKMVEAVQGDQRLPYGFVGDGWPQTSDQSWALEHDALNLKWAFHPDDWHTRDVGDAIYQANLLIPEMRQRNPEHTVVADIGAGYGRFGIPFVSWARYLAIDYSPIGLLTAPQVIEQVTGRVFFDSIPAWRLGTIPSGSVTLFVSIHSFQEMESESIAYYVQWMQRTAAPRALFYSVNLDESAWVPMIPESWPLVWDMDCPINRDGVFRQRLWEVVA